MRGAPEEGFFRPDMDERLAMQSGEKVFTIGSCFARNVEAFLSPRFEVPSRVNKADVPADIAALHPAISADLTIWHRYNVHSIRHSLAWALEPDRPEARRRLLAIDGGRSLDPYAGFHHPLATADAERVRRWIDATMATVRDCRVIILTLGLSELWEDSETGLALNCAPAREAWSAFPGRFRFRVANCAETLEGLEAIHALLGRHCDQDFQLVVTVSPIPLRATFRDLDIVVANAASKAILRAAVDQWAASHANVHYFPSYEMILASHPEGVWEADFRHCTPAVIRQVMAVFLAEFVAVDGQA